MMEATVGLRASGLGDLAAVTVHSNLMLFQGDGGVNVWIVLAECVGIGVHCIIFRVTQRVRRL